MCFKDNRYHANILYKELNILPLQDCYNLNLAIFMWKLEHARLPDNITSKYQRISHKYNTRESKKSTIQIPSIRLNHSKRYTIYNGSLLWINEVPLHLKMEKNIKLFSKKYRNYLINNLI